MAKGDVHFFAAWMLAVQSGAISVNLNSDAIKLSIVDNSVVPTASTLAPCFGAGGTTNFAAHQVATATGYSGPIAETCSISQSGAVVTLAASNVTIAQDASGFSNGYFGILYDNTLANKNCIGFIDLGGPVGNVAGPININWNASGFGTETAS